MAEEPPASSAPAPEEAAPAAPAEGASGADGSTEAGGAPAPANPLAADATAEEVPKTKEELAAEKEEAKEAAKAEKAAAKEAAKAAKEAKKHEKKPETEAQKIAREKREALHAKRVAEYLMYKEQRDEEDAKRRAADRGPEYGKSKLHGDPEVTTGMGLVAEAEFMDWAPAPFSCLGWAVTPAQKRRTYMRAYENRLEMNFPYAPACCFLNDERYMVDQTTVLYYDKPPFRTGLCILPCPFAMMNGCNPTCQCPVPVTSCGRPVVFSYDPTCCFCIDTRPYQGSSFNGAQCDFFNWPMVLPCWNPCYSMWGIPIAHGLKQPDDFVAKLSAAVESYSIARQVPEAQTAYFDHRSIFGSLRSPGEGEVPREQMMDRMNEKLKVAKLHADAKAIKDAKQRELDKQLKEERAAIAAERKKAEEEKKEAARKAKAEAKAAAKAASAGAPAAEGEPLLDGGEGGEGGEGGGAKPAEVQAEPAPDKAAKKP